MKKYISDLEKLKLDKSKNNIIKETISTNQNFLLRRKSSVVSIASTDLKSF